MGPIGCLQALDEQIQISGDVANSFSEEDLLRQAGISVEVIEEDLDLKEWKEEDVSHSLDEQIAGRLQTLVEKQSVAASLVILRDEFGEQMDEKTSAVLADFEALVSPVVIVDKTEREAVEMMFVTNFNGSLSRESFTTFVGDIYEQDDSVISEATKIEIEKKFKISRTEIHTGDELTQRVMTLDESGNPVFDSEENAVEFRSGLKAFAGKNGRVQLSLAGNSRVNSLEIPKSEIDDSETVAQYANYAAVRQLMYEELDGTTNLFGDGQEATTAAPSRTMVLDSKRFLDAVLERREPGDLLNREELDDLRMTLKAINPTPAVTETDAKNALEEIGVVRDGVFQWETLETIGGILRQTDYLRAFEYRSPGLAHERLKSALSEKSGVDSGYDQKKSAFRSQKSAFGEKRTWRCNVIFSGGSRHYLRI